MTWWKPWTWTSATVSDPRRSLAFTVSSYQVIKDAPESLAVGADIDQTYEFTLSAVDERHPVIVSFYLSLQTTSR
jgi:hypothetical protein